MMGFEVDRPNYMAFLKPSASCKVGGRCFVSLGKVVDGAGDSLSFREWWYDTLVLLWLWKSDVRSNECEDRFDQ